MTNRTYTIAMLAATRIGDGPLSEPVLVKTQQGGLSLRIIACLSWFASYKNVTVDRSNNNKNNNVGLYFIVKCK